MDDPAFCFTRLQSNDPKIKYGYGKILRETSETSPALLYPYFNQISGLLLNPNSILKWIAIDILGNLAKVDSDHKLKNILPTLIGFLHSGELITCNHAIFALTQYAKNNPSSADALLAEMMKVAKYPFDTSECREIAVGKVILAMEDLHGHFRVTEKVREFIEKAEKSSRPATRKKAMKLLLQEDLS